MDRQGHRMHSNRVKALEKERRKRKKFWWERKRRRVTTRCVKEALSVEFFFLCLFVSLWCSIAVLATVSLTSVAALGHTDVRALNKPLFTGVSFWLLFRSLTSFPHSLAPVPPSDFPPLTYLTQTSDPGQT